MNVKYALRDYASEEFLEELILKYDDIISVASLSKNACRVLKRIILLVIDLPFLQIKRGELAQLSNFHNVSHLGYCLDQLVEERYIHYKYVNKQKSTLVITINSEQLRNLIRTYHNICRVKESIQQEKNITSKSTKVDNL